MHKLICFNFTFILTVSGTPLTRMLHLSLVVWSLAGYAWVIKSHWWALPSDKNIIQDLYVRQKKVRHRHIWSTFSPRFSLQIKRSVLYFSRLHKKLRLLTVKYLTRGTADATQILPIECMYFVCPYPTKSIYFNILLFKIHLLVN